MRLPLAWPGLLLALSRTLMMAVGMVVITSLIDRLLSAAAEACSPVGSRKHKGTA
ncbi:ABC-type spermidine/putrescine transport system permease subunit I [Rhizobium aquaticum]|uniref:ABC-type spermidine/putrescine transport system permease subunit I n=1 Tax=Rhizobium aquaticum TaxID=1549636 RepID=A0ABV2J4T9_9HYPH